MEFIDPIVQEEKVPENQEPHTEGKTEQAVHQLEGEIDKAYGLVEKKFGELWSSASKNAGELQEKYKLDERRTELLKQLNAAKENIDDKAKVSQHLAQFELQLKSLGEHAKEVNIPEVDFKELSQKANSYLDTLDNKLEQVEKQAGQYVTKMASFFSGFVSINNGDAETEQTYEKETLFSSGLDASNYGTSRYDTDLLKLHTTPELILNAKDDDLASFKADDKTKEISELLEKYDTTLRKLMNELVPVKIPYNTFWYRYFKLEADLKQQDQNRKKLLDKEKKQVQDEEDFTWDDDEDEDEVVDVASELKNKSLKDEDDDDWE